MHNKSIEQMIKDHKELLEIYEAQADLHRNSISALEGLLRGSNNGQQALLKAIDACDIALADAPVASAWRAEFPNGEEKYGTLTVGDKQVLAYMTGIRGAKISSGPSIIKKRYNIWIIEA